jgi:hypothetical protein
MKFDARAVFAVLALVLASCQGGGFDSGMGGEMSPPVSQPGSMNGPMGGGLNNGLNNNSNNQLAGPNVGPNGQEELANPGATLAPNEAQYAISQGPSGMKCPLVQQFNQEYNCSLTFNMPTPSPSGSPNASATATPTPTPTPTPTSSSDDDSDDDSATPTPSPGGSLTMQMEPLPHDVPNMTNPNAMFMHITPLVAIRLQSNMDFVLNGGTVVQYTLPAMQYTGRVFALQLYNETSMRGKRVDQLISSYQKFTTPQSNTVQFQFNVPKVTVRHTQVWLLALYGAQIPPGTTPTPSPTPATSPSPSPSVSP